MALCDPSSPSNSSSTAGMSAMMFPDSSRNATSASSPPAPCAAASSSASTAMIIATISGFVVVMLVTGLLVYMFHRLGWLNSPEASSAARLRAFRENAGAVNSSQGLDPAMILSFPVYTFREKLASCEVTTDSESEGFVSLRRISRELSHSALGSARPDTRDFSASRSPSWSDDSSIDDGDSAKQSHADENLNEIHCVVTVATTEEATTEDEEEATMPCRRECAVCLGDYMEGEHIKVVPACGHGFHADCIDLWLSAKPTCPICRCDLRPTPEAAELDVTVTEETGILENVTPAPGAAAPAAAAGAVTAGDVVAAEVETAGETASVTAGTGDQNEAARARGGV